jgi:uncharacterized membrane protein YfcA
MTVSERVYQALLVAYPAEHRRRYGEPMVLLFRDRMRRDGGGFGTVLVWGLVGYDLLSSAFRERMETAMTAETWTSRWWEATVVVLAANSVVFGVIALGKGYVGIPIAFTLAPVALLIAGLALRSTWRVGATVMVVVGSIAAAGWWWMAYPVVLAAVVIIGGIATHKIGPRSPQHQAATPPGTSTEATRP